MSYGRCRWQPQNAIEDWECGKVTSWNTLHVCLGVCGVHDEIAAPIDDDSRTSPFVQLQEFAPPCHHILRAQCKVLLLLAIPTAAEAFKEYIDMTAQAAEYSKL